ncbi:flippase [Ampullimonas aquatilis]|uniref:flippase n=1 Tax=Ampullimonas aquatilis TaxID=1341549 RepID=UPI003C752F8C
MSKLITNIASLYVIQAANYLLPLITLPYLIRTLGFENFGVLSYAGNIIQYFVIFTDFGFNLTATREVSINRADSIKLNEIVSSVFVLKFLFLLLSFILFLCLINFFSEAKEHATVFLASFLLVIGNVLFPNWLFQGIEKMPLVTIMNVLPKLITVPAIFYFVKSPGDIATAAIIQSIGNIIGGAIGLLLIKANLPNLQFKMPTREVLIRMLNDGKYIFASQLSGLMVNSSHMLILGYFHGAYAVGHYAVAEKIIKAANNAQVPICNAVYPKLAALFAKSKSEGFAFIRSMLKWLFPLMLTGSIGLFLLANWVTYLVSGEHSREVTIILRIMSIIPTSVFLDNLLGTQVLINLGYRAQFMWAIFISGLSGVFMALIFVPKFGALASAWVYLGSQITVLLLMSIFINRNIKFSSFFKS